MKMNGLSFKLMGIIYAFQTLNYTVAATLKNFIYSAIDNIYAKT